MRADSLTTIVPADSRLYAEGLLLFAARPDQQWSLVDCMSFVLMREMGLTDALTADEDFEQAGFRALLKAGIAECKAATGDGQLGQCGVQRKFLRSRGRKLVVNRRLFRSGTLEEQPDVNFRCAPPSTPTALARLNWMESFSSLPHGRDRLTPE